MRLSYKWGIASCILALPFLLAGCLTTEEVERIDEIAMRQVEIKGLLNGLADGTIDVASIDWRALSAEWDDLSGEMADLKEKSNGSWIEMVLLPAVFMLGNRIPYVGPYIKPLVKLGYRLFAGAPEVAAKAPKKKRGT